MHAYIVLKHVGGKHGILSEEKLGVLFQYSNQKLGYSKAWIPWRHEMQCGFTSRLYCFDNNIVSWFVYTDEILIVVLSLFFSAVTSAFQLLTCTLCLHFQDWGCVILREIDILLKFADRFLAYTHRWKYILEQRYVQVWIIAKRRKQMAVDWFLESIQKH